MHLKWLNLLQSAEERAQTKSTGVFQDEELLFSHTQQKDNDPDVDLFATSGKAAVSTNIQHNWCLCLLVLQFMFSFDRMQMSFSSSWQYVVYFPEFWGQLSETSSTQPVFRWWWRWPFQLRQAKTSTSGISSFERITKHTFLGLLFWLLWWLKKICLNQFFILLSRR